jgi:predicted acetyltransferase
LNFISRKENLKETLTITLEEIKERGIDTVLIVSTRDYCDLGSLRFLRGPG